MSEEPSLESLQAMTQRVLDKVAGHGDDFHEIRSRLTAIERQLAGVRRDAQKLGRDRWLAPALVIAVVIGGLLVVAICIARIMWE